MTPSPTCRSISLTDRGQKRDCWKAGGAAGLCSCLVVREVLRGVAWRWIKARLSPRPASCQIPGWELKPAGPLCWAAEGDVGLKSCVPTGPMAILHSGSLLGLRGLAEPSPLPRRSLPGLGLSQGSAVKHPWRWELEAGACPQAQALLPLGSAPASPRWNIQDSALGGFRQSFYMTLYKTRAQNWHF